MAVWLAPAVAVALAQIAAQLVDFQLYDLHLRALNANSDASVVAWLTPAGMALALAGILACLRRRDMLVRAAPYSRRSSSDCSWSRAHGAERSAGRSRSTARR